MSEIIEIKYIQDVKSLYLVKNIFLYLNEKQKLELIIYNKQLQKILGFDIEYYKEISGKYIRLEKNGKGKEYDLNSNKLIFEGEYLNGKRNGKGKEYYLYNDNIKFEGEYLNGKRWNGKGYNEDGNIEYEIKDGKGHIKERWYNGDFIFEGECLNGEIKGKGEEYDIDGNLKFEGEYLNWKRNGKRKEYYYEGQLKFEGEYLNGKIWNGKGYNKKGLQFEIKEGKGQVKEYDYEFGYLEFEGEYSNGERNGQGKEYNVGNLEFEGEYLNGKRNGKGIDYYILSKKKFEGEFLNGKMWNGKGYNINGDVEFEIINGKGIIKEYNFITLIFEGQVLNGKRNGKGKEYDYSGKLVFEGEYLNGKKWNGKEYDGNGKIKGEIKNGIKNNNI